MRKLEAAVTAPGAVTAGSTPQAGDLANRPPLEAATAAGEPSKHTRGATLVCERAATPSGPPFEDAWWAS